MLKLLLPSECRAGMALRVPEADDFGSGLPLDAPLTGGCGALELGNATSIEDCEAGAGCTAGGAPVELRRAWRQPEWDWQLWVGRVLIMLVVIWNTLSDSITAIDLVRYRKHFGIDGRTRRCCGRKARYFACCLIYFVFSGLAIAYGVLMVSLSCNLLDAFANSLALLFVNDIDERCFELMQSLGWVDSFESEKSKSGRIDAAGKARRRPGCCARLCAARETAQEVCGASVYVFFTMFSPLGWLLATLVSALQLLVILNFVILNSKVTPLMAPLVTLFEGNTVGRLNRDGNVTETAPFTWENVTTAYIALFSSSAGSNAVCRAVQAKGGVGTLALAETYGSTDYDDGLDIFSQLLAASGTYSNFSAAEVLGGVVEKVEETGSGEDASFSLAKLGDAADELFARWDEIPFWGHRSLYGTLLVVLIVAFVNTAPEAVKALKLLRRCHFVAALVHASFFILAMCFSFLVAFSSCDPDSFRDALALMFILDVDERVYAITPRWLTKAGTGKSRGAAARWAPTATGTKGRCTDGSHVPTSMSRREWAGSRRFARTFFRWVW